REIGARRHEDGEVIKAGGAAYARRALALREHEEIRAARSEPRGPFVAPIGADPKSSGGPRRSSCRDRSQSSHHAYVKPCATSTRSSATASPPAAARR